MENFNQIDHNSALPLYAQVEKLLRDLIEQPDYKNGKFLPNEVDLAKRLGVSRNTIRQATNQLVIEGLIERKKGVGTKVSNKKRVVTRLDHWLSFTHEMNKQGIVVKNYEINTEWVKPEDELKEFFNIKEEKEILRLKRLRGADKGPIVYFISYFHPRVGLTGNEDFSQPLYHLLETECHTVASTSREEIKAIIADKYIAGKLMIKEGDPVLFRKRFVFDPGNRPIEYNVGYYNADDFTYSIEIQRGQ
ncbi:MAG: GntR family transcriptional regulator [Ignavibacteria bacterium]|jgi:GntR family transcriptional regulator